MLKRLAPLLGSHYTYPVWNRCMEILGIATYVVFAALLSANVVASLADPTQPFHNDAFFWLAPVALVAALAADFVSGFVHCAADNFGSPTTPFFGVAFIRPFRDHHRDPLDITRHDFVETNGNSCIVNLLVLIPTFLYFGATPTLGKVLIAVFILMFTLAIVLTNQIHKWAHMPIPPRQIALLQRYRIILPPDNHQVHHTPPFDKNYCITTGWMNAAIERSGVFAWMVRVFR